MSLRITHDANAPTASAELIITRPLPEYDIQEVARAAPRQVDEILVSQGFRDLVDDAHGILAKALESSGLEVVQLTGAICHRGEAHHPGLWVVLRESAARPGQPMSAAARQRMAAAVETLRASLHLS